MKNILFTIWSLIILGTTYGQNKDNKVKILSDGMYLLPNGDIIELE